MKTIVFFLLSVLAFSKLQGQDTLTFSLDPLWEDDCGTPDPDTGAIRQLPWYNNEAWFDDYTPQEDFQENAVSDNPEFRINHAPLYHIPIHFWVYQIDDNTPGGENILLLPGARQYQLGLDVLNQGFENNGLPIRFYIACIDFIDAPDALTMGQAESTIWGLAYHDDASVNIHIKDAGRQLYNSVADAIFINRATLFEELLAATLPHEFGHFFGLFHTHNFWNLPCLSEPVARIKFDFRCLPILRTCANTGDMLCDTPADPNMSRDKDVNDIDGDGDSNLVDNNNGCSYIGSDPAIDMRDGFNDLYSPDVNNFMAYSNHNCRSHFTEQQKKVILHNLFKRTLIDNAHWRSQKPEYLVDAYEPDNEVTTARPISLQETQEHTFHDYGCNPDAVDWLLLQPAENILGGYTLTFEAVEGFEFPVAASVQVFNANQDGVISDEIPANISSTNNSVTVIFSCDAVTSQSPRVRVPRNFMVNTGAYTVSLNATIPQPAFSGDALLDKACVGNLLELINIPEGATVIWNSGDINLSSTTSNCALITEINPGTMGSHVRVSITAGSCTYYMEKLFETIALAPISYIHKTETIGPCPEKLYTYFINPVVGATDYFWTCDGCIVAVATDGLSATVSSNDVFPLGADIHYTLSVTVSSNCGESSTTSVEDDMETDHPLDCERRGPVIIISPNPSDQYIDLTIEHDIENATYDLYISRQIDAFLQYNQSIDEKNWRIETQDFPNGFYYLHLVYEGEISSEIFLVQH